ncbi:hypothetical protein P9199_14145, partial [Geobacillus stearothermophilus]|nr:hypothetical protein [Geobacillus stearothermophilus]
DDILTQNGYTYANNNPVMLVDPDGHFFWFAVNAGFACLLQNKNTEFCNEKCRAEGKEKRLASL